MAAISTQSITGCSGGSGTMQALCWHYVLIKCHNMFGSMCCVCWSGGTNYTVLVRGFHCILDYFPHLSRLPCEVLYAQLRVLDGDAVDRHPRRLALGRAKGRGEVNLVPEKRKKTRQNLRWPQFPKYVSLTRWLFVVKRTKTCRVHRSSEAFGRVGLQQ